MNKLTDAVEGLDPDDLNNSVFKLVTILVFLLCHKNTTFPPFFDNSATTILSPPPSVVQ